MRLLFALAAATLLAAALTPPASAHANLVSTSPADGATVERVPPVVRIRFDDPVRVGPGNAVVANRGGSVTAGPARLEGGGRELVLPLGRLAGGDYSVRWRIVSDAGHLETGVLAFRVGAAGFIGSRPTSVLEAGSTRPRTGDLIARWVFIGSILLAGGAALFRLLVSRARRDRAAVTMTAALIGAVLGGAWLLHSTQAGGTRFGHVTSAAILVAAAGALAAACSLIYPRLLPVAVAASLALLAAPSLGGHALEAGRFGLLSLAADLGHVVAAAFWTGGLFQLALSLRRRENDGVARRYSWFALPAAAGVAATGSIRALGELSAMSQLWSTGYGRVIVVKAGLFTALLGLGWLSRRRLHAAGRLLRPVTAELALLAVAVGAVAVLTALPPGTEDEARTVANRAADAGPAPAPPLGSVVFARDVQELAVALAVRPGRRLRLTSTIIGGSGRGVDGLDVRLAALSGDSSASAAGRTCGHGCYAAGVRLARPTAFAVTIGGAGRFRSVTFAVPGPWPPPPGDAFLRRASSAFRDLRSAVFVERLASSPDRAIRTTWRLAAPDRVSYTIRSGAAGIIIGSRRWDRPAPHAGWQRSGAAPLRQPVPPWGTRMANARVLRQRAGTATVSWVDRTVPAWFTATFDTKTALPTTLRMTAAAHFMRHRYVSFDRAVRIEPPRKSR